MIVASGFSGLLGFVRNAALIVILHSSALGTYLFLQGIMYWLEHGHMGIFYGLHREVAMARGQEAKRLYSTAALSGGPLAIVAALGAGLFCHARGLHGGVTSLIVGYGLVKAWEGLLQGEARGSLRFKAVAAGQNTLAAVRLGLTLLAAPLFGIEGALAADVVGRAMGAVVLRRPRKPLPIASPTTDALRALAVSGIPVLLVSIGQTGFLTIDRFYIERVLEPADLGSYAHAALVIVTTVLAASAMNAFAYPHMARIYNRDLKTLRGLVNLSRGTAQYLVTASSASIVAIFAVLNQLGVRTIDTVAGRRAAIIVVVGVAGVSQAGIGLALLNAAGRGRWAVGLQVLTLASMAAALPSVTEAHSIVGTASVMAIGFLTMGIASSTACSVLINTDTSWILDGARHVGIQGLVCIAAILALVSVLPSVAWTAIAALLVVAGWAGIEALTGTQELQEVAR